MEAKSRTNKMKAGKLKEIDPLVRRNHKVQTNTASEDKTYYKTTKK